jgi:precorrin-6A/cobalt-precorrin-6A reductase
MSAKPPCKLLILGGTLEARQLAAMLDSDSRFSVISSLAGRTAVPASVTGQTRTGGFGGMAGLARYLADEAVDIIVDATHPFAAAISLNAARAAAVAGVSCLHLRRPAWQPTPQDRWLIARDVADAAHLMPAGARALLTIGRQQLAPFVKRPDVTIFARMIEPPDIILPAHMELILARPPFILARELALMEYKRIGLLVTKNAGGPATRAKLDAARERGATVIMIERPAGQPPADATTLEELMPLLEHHVA